MVKLVQILTTATNAPYNFSLRKLQKLQIHFEVRANIIKTYQCL